MTEPSLTTGEREALFAKLGFAPGLAATVTTTAPVVVEHVHHTPVIEPSKPQAESQTPEAFVRALLLKHPGKKDAAFAAVRAHRDAEFARLKLDKYTAAQRGLSPTEKSEHNKALYAQLRSVEESMNALVRKHFKDNGGFVQAKVQRAKDKPVSPELDAFMLKNADNEVLRQFLALQAQTSTQA